MGHIISKEKISVNPDNSDAISSWITLICIKKGAAALGVGKLL